MELREIDREVSGFALLVAALCLITLTVVGAVAEDRTIQRIKQINQLSHDSGQLGSYKALVIGIDTYQDKKIPNLKTAVNDAKAIDKVLREEYGFSTELLLNEKANKASIYNALRKIAADSHKSDSLLIYYAGHGDLDRVYDEGWWIPSDARGGNPLTYLDNNEIQKAMRKSSARHVLLISDSCYSGTLFGESRAIPRVITDKYYLSLYNEKSRWGMTSGNKTPVSDSGSGGHSVFAYHLLKELQKTAKQFLSTQELYTRIAPIIRNNSEQTPLCRPVRNTGDQGGEFVFVRTKAGADTAKVEESPAITPQPVKQTPVVTILAEEELWQEVKGSGDESQLQLYLDTYPSGRFATVAQLKISKLQKVESKPVVASSSSHVLTENYTDPVTGMEFVLVKGGCYQMGSPFGGRDEKPLHKVCVDSFYMGKYEVTQGEYEEVAGNNPSGFKRGDHYPVENVNWNDAQEYIQELNNRSGKKIRLPTEAEWEYAARSGGKREKYSGGARIDTVAWYSETSRGRGGTQEVGTKEANDLGLYDMSGNVWEWCSDLYGKDFYGKSPANNPQGPTKGVDRVRRGGSWSSSAWDVRSTRRVKESPTYSANGIGFRLVF